MRLRGGFGQTLGGRKRHSRRHKRSKRHKHEGIKEEDLSIDDALQRVPRKVGSLFSEYKKAPDAAKADEVLEHLNTVYMRAQREKDHQGLDCTEKASAAKREVRDARGGLMETERQLTQLNDRMRSIQAGIDRALAEVEALRVHFKRRRALCEENQKGVRNAIDLLETDLPQAKNLVSETTQGCAGGGSPPALVECSMPDGAFVTTFKDKSMRERVSNLSGTSERLVALHLDRSVRGHGPDDDSGTSLLEVRRATHRLASGHRFLARRSFPEHLCADAPAPKCEALTDNMATLSGNIEDLVDELKVRAQKEEGSCTQNLESTGARVKDLKRQADDSTVQLANTAAERSQVDAARRERRMQVEDVLAEAHRESAECTRAVADADEVMCSTRKLHMEMKAAGQTMGAFLGDCWVTEWIYGQCSKPCGHGGLQNLTRNIVSAPKTGAKCPPLNMTRSCNEKPCPVDAIMGRWEDWSPCSRACGGGTRTRRRPVERQAQYGGLPAAETMQEELCNPLPCDQDCELLDWTAWSNCSKACGHGHRLRARSVLRAERGEGTCPNSQDSKRREALRCNLGACNATFQPYCASFLDLVVVFDVSGSVGADGVEAAKTFLKDSIARLGLGPSGATAGLISYSDSATVLQELSTDQAAITAQVDAVTWLKTGTNTGEALALARRMLEERGRNGAESAVVVLTDGMPLSSHIVGAEAEQLRALGARVAFLAVGPGVSRGALRHWASWPPEDNIVEAPNYNALNANKTTELLMTICSELAD